MSTTVIIGPMFSGKTTELCRQIERKRIAKKKCMIIKKDIDTRFSSVSVVTHSKSVYDQCEIKHMSEITEDDLQSIIKDGYEAVGIEEGHFFTNLKTICDTLSNNSIDTIVSALNGDFEQKPFKEVSELFATPDHIVHLTAICMVCHEAEAAFSIRTTESKETILVGGEEAYKSVCRKCLIAHNASK